VAFSTMFSIRNVDIAHKIAVRSVRYHDTDGKLLIMDDAAIKLEMRLSTISASVASV
jgi:hypothetical protein